MTRYLRRQARASSEDPEARHQRHTYPSRSRNARRTCSVFAGMHKSERGVLRAPKQPRARLSRADLKCRSARFGGIRRDAGPFPQHRARSCRAAYQQPGFRLAEEAEAFWAWIKSAGDSRRETIAPSYLAPFAAIHQCAGHILPIHRVETRPPGHAEAADARRAHAGYNRKPP